MQNEQIPQAECCAKFDPTPWNEQTIEWQDKLFIKKTVPTFLHMPIPGMFGNMITKAWKQIEDAQAKPEIKDYLLISHDPSLWKSENYFHVTKEVPGAENVKLSGTFMTKVFEGSYSGIPTWVKEMEGYVSSKGKSIKKLYFYYTTCPKCAKKYGKNYVVIFAQV